MSASSVGGQVDQEIPVVASVAAKDGMNAKEMPPETAMQTRENLAHAIPDMTLLTTQLHIEPSDPHSEEATRLLRDMRAEALSRYSDSMHESTPPATNDPLVPRSAFLLARLDRQAVGCAALRPIDADAAEIRRMYVAPAVRRRGIGRRLLAELARIALDFGYTILRLETGNRQPEATALYQSCGFQPIPPYGCHVSDPLSICFEKRIALRYEHDLQGAV